MGVALTTRVVIPCQPARLGPLFTCRATGRIREGTMAALLTGITAVGLAIVAAPSLGLPGIAGAWLIAQVLAALGAAVRLRTLLLSGARSALEAESTSLAPAEQMVVPAARKLRHCPPLTRHHR